MTVAQKPSRSYRLAGYQRVSWDMVNRTSPASPQLMATYQEAADALRISRSMIKKLVKSGLLRPVRIGRCRRILLVELGKFMQ